MLCLFVAMKPMRRAMDDAEAWADRDSPAKPA